eukprot:TRINITY_DN668_c0_g1_i2.p1 TRINITY_DN668_c0_g1~~TRINITY_DN668_c0_g1_i2.p1  ORF type:complete len:240 (+),score=70.99 TRINITY_DN668_c0_g1_i2:534-1253(+)
MFVNDFRVRLGSFYFLYTLWMTQREPKLPIRISVEMWTKLVKMMNDEVVAFTLKEAAVIFRKMRDGRAFNFVAQARIVLPPSVVAGTTSLKKDVRSWDPSEHLGSVMTTRFDVEEFREVLMQYISARNEVEQLDGATLAQPTPEDLDALLQSFQNANHISTAGLASHYPTDNSQGNGASQQQQQQGQSQGDSMDVDQGGGSQQQQQQQQHAHMIEGPAEMGSEDEGMFGGPQSPAPDGI